MAIEFTTTKDSFDRGGNYLDAPGTYHVSVLDANDQPSSNEGKLIDGWKVRVSVMAGTVPGQEKKEIDITFWNPNLNDDEKKQAKTRGKQARFLEAVCLIDRHSTGTAKIELAEANGRQMIVTLTRKQRKDAITGRYVDEERGLQLNFADVFHVDDPDAAGFPKHAAAISLLPGNLRRERAYFGVEQHSNGNGKSKSQTNQQAVGAGVDLDSL